VNDILLHPCTAWLDLIIPHMVQVVETVSDHTDTPKWQLDRISWVDVNVPPKWWYGICQGFIIYCHLDTTLMFQLFHHYIKVTWHKTNTLESGKASLMRSELFLRDHQKTSFNSGEMPQRWSSRRWASLWHFPWFSPYGRAFSWFNQIPITLNDHPNTFFKT
jgi:hypothetical protein